MFFYILYAKFIIISNLNKTDYIYVKCKFKFRILTLFSAICYFYLKFFLIVKICMYFFVRYFIYKFFRYYISYLTLIEYIYIVFFLF